MWYSIEEISPCEVSIECERPGCCWGQVAADREHAFAVYDAHHRRSHADEGLNGVVPDLDSTYSPDDALTLRRAEAFRRHIAARESEQTRKAQEIARMHLLRTR